MLLGMLERAARFSLRTGGKDRASGVDNSEELRAALGMILLNLIEGRFDDAFAEAADTLPATRPALRALDADTYRKMVVAASYAGEGGAAVFMTPVQAGDYALSFTFNRGADGYRPLRVDIVFYPGIYDWLTEGGASTGTRP
jgi:hypothetical protein